MADSKNWAYVQTPKIIFEEIEKILKNEEFRKLGYFKPKDVAVILFRQFIQNPQMILESQDGKLSIIDTHDSRIILNDSKTGIMLVEIDENNKLQCYNCKEDPHKNRYVDFCLKSESLWKFLKSKNVKLIIPRK